MSATANQGRRYSPGLRDLLGATFVAVLLVPVGSTAAGDQERSGWMSDGNAAYITLGFGSVSLADDPAEAQYESWEARDPKNLERSGKNVSLDAGVFFVKAISMGFRYEHHRAEYFIKKSGFFGPVRDVRYKTRINEILLDVRAWMPPRKGLLLGVAGGLSDGELVGDPDNWSATAGVYQFYTGGQFAFSEGNAALMVVRVGYSLRDFGTVDEGFAADSVDTIELDMSGWFFEINFGGIARIRN